MSLSDAMKWLTDTMIEKEGESIVYSRGVESVTLDAVPGKTEYESVTETGVVTEHQARDFVVNASELIIDEAAIEPKRGDKITYGGDTFEVFPLDGEKVYRYSDPFKKMLRIHTKQVG